MRKGILTGLGVTAVALAGGAGSASAATITVANTNDSGVGSLREALEVTANDGDLILLPAGTYDVGGGDIGIEDAVTIRGAGARKTILLGASDRVLTVGPGQTTVTIEDLRISGGNSGANDGGGILALSDLVLDRTAFIDNEADPVTTGGFGDGGGVYAAEDLTVSRSLFAGNLAYNGGAIYTEAGFTLRDSTVTDNTAGAPALNAGNGYGGAFELDGPAEIRGSTIVNNRDFGDTSGAGAVANYGSLTVQNSIIADNFSYVDNGDPVGSPGNPGFEHNCYDAVTVDLNNIEGVSDCGFASSTSRQNADPSLGPLADNGGPTDTHALLLGSPALNKGASCSPTDQRGLTRSLGGTCDIGAYELVRCGGVIVNRVGTSGKDTLIGTSGSDGILALGGSDLLKGLAGKDALCGGNGRDRLLGGKGRDKLFGGKGRDRLRGGPGRDRLRGGPGRDLQRQ